jgi:hypothetical protein
MSSLTTTYFSAQQKTAIIATTSAIAILLILVLVFALSRDVNNGNPVLPTTNPPPQLPQPNFQLISHIESLPDTSDLGILVEFNPFTKAGFTVSLRDTEIGSRPDRLVGHFFHVTETGELKLDALFLPFSQVTVDDRISSIKVASTSNPENENNYLVVEVESEGLLEYDIFTYKYKGDFAWEKVGATKLQTTSPFLPQDVWVSQEGQLFGLFANGVYNFQQGSTPDLSTWENKIKFQDMGSPDSSACFASETARVFFATIRLGVVVIDSYGYNGKTWNLQQSNGVVPGASGDNVFTLTVLANGTGTTVLVSLNYIDGKPPETFVLDYNGSSYSNSPACLLTGDQGSYSCIPSALPEVNMWVDASLTFENGLFKGMYKVYRNNYEPCQIIDTTPGNFKGDPAVFAFVQKNTVLSQLKLLRPSIVFASSKEIFLFLSNDNFFELYSMQI